MIRMANDSIRRTCCVLLGVILIGLLAGCGSSATGGSTSTDSAAEVESTGMEEAPSADETEAVEEETMEFVGDKDGFVTLIEREEYCLAIRLCKDVKSGLYLANLRLENRLEQAISVYIDGWTVNQSVTIGGNVFWLDPLETEINEIHSFSEALYLGEVDRLEEISCRVELEDEQFQPIAEDSVNLEVNASVIYPDDYFPFMGAKAGEQVLFENEKIRAVLLGAGQKVTEDSSYSSHLSGVVRFDNKTDVEAVISINGIQLNGISINTSGSRYYTLDGGMSQFIPFSFYSNDIEEKLISSISDMSILILSDREDATNLTSMKGGKWYTVELEEKGDVVEATREGVVLLEDERLRFTNIGQSKEERYSSLYYYWDFVIENFSDEDYEFRWIDVTVNGVPHNELEGVYILVRELVAADGSSQFRVETRLEPGSERPTLGFKVRLVAQGGGTLIHEYEDTFTVEPMAEEDYEEKETDGVS